MTVSLTRQLETSGYLTLNKFVKYLKSVAPQAAVSYPTALKYVKEGKIHAIPVGSQYRIDRIEVERWIREGNSTITFGSGGYPKSY